jgi:hypothetical protein
MSITSNASKVLILTSASIFGFGSAGAQTADQPRAGQIDAYGAAVYIGGQSGNVTSGGLHFDLDSTWGWGLGLGYHFTDQWSVLMDVVFASTDLALTQNSSTTVQPYRQGADYSNSRVNVEYTPRPGPVSPVLSAGIGWDSFHTYVPGAPPQVYCGPSFYSVYWWCATGVPTYTQTAFAGNVGIGVRWDPSASLFLKFMYVSTWAEFSGISGTRQFNQIMMQIGGKMQ